MRKTFLAILAVIIMFTLSGCSSLLLNLSTMDTDRIAEEQAQKIINALDARDEAALASLLSRKVQSEVDDLDEGLAYIMGEYQGFSQTSELIISPMQEDHYGAPGRQKHLLVRYVIKTNEETYTLYFEYRAIDEAEPEEEGITYIKLAKGLSEADSTNRSDNRWYSGSYCNRLGIFNPTWDEDQEKIEAVENQILAVLNEQNQEALRNMISPKVLSEVDDLDAGLASVFGQYEGPSTQIMPTHCWIDKSEESGDYTETIYSRFSIYTDKLNYGLVFEYQLVDEANPDAVGLTFLVLSTPHIVGASEEGNHTSEAYGRVGIYYPGWD